MGQTNARPLNGGGPVHEDFIYTPEMLRGLLARGIRPDLLLPPEMHRMPDEMFYGGNPAKPRQIVKIVNPVHLRKSGLRVSLPPPSASPSAGAGTGIADPLAVTGSVSFILDAKQPARVTAIWNLSDRPVIQSSTVPAGLNQPVSFPLPSLEEFSAALDSAHSNPGSPHSGSGSSAAASAHLTIRVEPTGGGGIAAPLFERKEAAGSTLNADAEVSFITFSRKAGSSHDVEARVTKQQMRAGGKEFDVADIYGMEPKNSAEVAIDISRSSPQGGEEEGEEGNGFQDCTVCMSSPRDIAVLPCRHLCLCHECAITVRRQTNRCPICRAVVEAMVPLPPPASGVSLG